MRTASASAGAAIAALSARGALAASALPPEPITKAGAIIGWVFTAGATAYVIYEGTQIARVSKEILAIADFIETESKFVERCQHVRKDFLEEAAKLGISLSFPANGGQFIDARDYQESLAKERQLYDQVSERAIRDRITTAEAYKKYFREECGQLPVVDVSPQDQQYKDPAKIIPEHIAARARDTDQSLDLLSRKPLYFAGWTSGDVYSNDQKDTLYRFFIHLKEQIEKWKVKSPQAYQRFRTRYQEIYIKPRSRSWFGGSQPISEQKTDHGTTTLIIYLERTGSFYAGYDYNIAKLIEAWSQDGG